MSAEHDEERYGRRPYDRDREIDPVVEAFLERRLTDTRHLLRGEFTAAMLQVTNGIVELGQTVAKGNLQAVADHAEVKTQLAELRRDVKSVLPLKRRVSDLERHDDVDDAREDERSKVFEALAAQQKWMTEQRRWTIGLTVSLGGIGLAVISQLLSHG